MRHCNDRIVADLRDLKAAVIDPLAHLAAEFDLDRVVLAGAEPYVAHLQPVVGELHLPAVDNLLTEDAELIANGIARHVISQTSCRVHIAGGQPAETAVAETGVRLQRIDIVNIEARLFQALSALVFNAEIEEVVAKARADKEFHRHIVDFLLLLFGAAVIEKAVFIVQKLAHNRAECTIDLLLRCIGQGAAAGALQGLVQFLHHIDPLLLAQRFYCLLGCLLFHESS